ncbi:proline/glycine betaine ABC transporter permease [Rhodobacter sp. 24-YEA-8]|uniref:ABC transporter permease n=1 Tax=Rhodobacter sp. 24-YEA-8 TaxID=1884310 RepID=UPI00089A189E|nr:ABC transporter permease subunit [Rhodobacter sp. 24-YEA-8]SED45192.1 glycine betaine/proline transport system permease protein [Rhodobacter sp. 24-YEA-8]
MLDILTIPQLPLKRLISDFIDLLGSSFSGLFAAFASIIQMADTALRQGLNSIPPAAMILLIVGYLLCRRRGLAAPLVGLGLAMVWNIGSWGAALDTVSLLILATLPALGFGLAIGVVIAESRWARSLLEPVLDLMQTLPAFVYLIPSVLFFGVGAVPGVIATAIFALPPFARAVALGLSEVPAQFVEVGRSVGLTDPALLLKVKIPLATPYMLTGLSQTVMMSLSMVVIASLIGAPGLGTQVVESLSQMDFALGIEAGLCIVILAITIERILEAGIAGRWIWKR